MQGLSTRHQDAIEHRIEGARQDPRTGEDGDRRRGRIGLLGGNAAVLDRKVSRVTRREDVVGASDSAVLIHGDEPPTHVRIPASAGPRSSGSATIRSNSSCLAPGETVIVFGLGISQ